MSMKTKRLSFTIDLAKAPPSRGSDFKYSHYFLHVWQGRESWASVKTYHKWRKTPWKKYLGGGVDYWPSWELFSQQATNSNSCPSRMCLAPQGSQGMCILWLKAAVLSSCYRKKYHQFNLSWSQPFSTGCLYLLFVSLNGTSTASLL